MTFLLPLLNRRQLLYIDAPGPVLQRGGILPLGFDLQEIPFRDHQPEGAVFAFVLKSFEPVVAIEVN